MPGEHEQGVIRHDQSFLLQIALPLLLILLRLKIAIIGGSGVRYSRSSQLRQRHEREQLDLDWVNNQSMGRRTSRTGPR